MTQQWDTQVSNEEKPNEKSRAIRARQRAIGRELRRMYDDVAQESIPDEFLDLLKKIEEAGFDVFSGVIRVPRPRQAVLAARMWWTLR